MSLGLGSPGSLRKDAVRVRSGPGEAVRRGPAKAWGWGGAGWGSPTGLSGSSSSSSRGRADAPGPWGPCLRAGVLHRSSIREWQRWRRGAALATAPPIGRPRRRPLCGRGRRRYPVPLERPPMAARGGAPRVSPGAALTDSGLLPSASSAPRSRSLRLDRPFLESLGLGQPVPVPPRSCSPPTSAGFVLPSSPSPPPREMGPNLWGCPPGFPKGPPSPHPPAW